MQARATSRAFATEATTVALAALWEVLLHRSLPRSVHLRANLVASAALIMLGESGGLTPADIGLDPQQFRKGLRSGVIAGTIAAAVIFAASSLPTGRRRFAGEHADRRPASEPREIMHEAAVRIPFATALFEEVLFRGVLFGFALRRTSPARAVATNSILFALWHVIPTLSDLDRSADPTRKRPTLAVAGSMWSTALAAVVFCTLRRRSGSLLAPVILHAAINASALVAGWAAQSRQAKQST